MATNGDFEMAVDMGAERYGLRDRYRQTPR